MLLLLFTFECRMLGSSNSVPSQTVCDWANAKQTRDESSSLDGGKDATKAFS